MSLPIFQSANNPQFTQMQTVWASQLDALLTNPLVNGQVLQSVPLVIGANQINHKLGRKLQGWCLTRKRGSADIYDTQDANSMPQLTLSLVSDAVVTVDIYVF